jgi:hypothetical protein
MESKNKKKENEWIKLLQEATKDSILLKRNYPN